VRVADAAVACQRVGLRLRQVGQDLEGPAEARLEPVEVALHRRLLAQLLVAERERDGLAQAVGELDRLVGPLQGLVVAPLLRAQVAHAEQGVCPPDLGAAGGKVVERGADHLLGPLPAAGADQQVAGGAD
jgi:hypothetical protein